MNTLIIVWPESTNTTKYIVQIQIAYLFFSFCVVF